MMRVDLDGHPLPLWIDWEYDRDLGYAHCTVRIGSDPRRSPVYTDGFAYKSPADNFCKRVGRKISLTRAIAKFARENRRKIWMEYLVTCNDLTKGKP